MSEENVPLIRNMYDALARGDLYTFANSLHPEIQWIVAPGFPFSDGNPWVGREGVGRLFMAIMEKWKRFKIVPAEIFPAGETTVVALGQYSAICRATGKPVEAQFAHVGELRDRMVVRYRQFADTVQFARAMTP